MNVFTDTTKSRRELSEALVGLTVVINEYFRGKVTEYGKGRLNEGWVKVHYQHDRVEYDYISAMDPTGYNVFADLRTNEPIYLSPRESMPGCRRLTGYGGLYYDGSVQE